MQPVRGAEGWRVRKVATRLARRGWFDEQQDVEALLILLLAGCCCYQVLERSVMIAWS